MSSDDEKEKKDTPKEKSAFEVDEFGRFQITDPSLLAIVAGGDDDDDDDDDDDEVAGNIAICECNGTMCNPGSPTVGGGGSDGGFGHG
ncbi:hypothetical protein G6L29_30050 [Agrobacterium rhizogenes]|uniref:hypothetical protein n=1 Tax=Rhizobium rhizogenes TaxID=359 RepID=UPI00103B7F15|nr:hypothetical protein [Rhizobium rhizogenes]NTG91100.1 hypothetical protein [Rhizobium rhizogenes]NTG91102.1 hypothetical protein [Rhizobium rhizogenes]NTI19908.1 hypothetical protein [Rhizobium rhizogenes]NTI19910.1 hypothetical protein [Rhizobium rhizogenes]QRM40599.1 hypothetical protein F3X89_22600 [Rhizobium rhizogenes]